MKKAQEEREKTQARENIIIRMERERGREREDVLCD